MQERKSLYYYQYLDNALITSKDGIFARTNRLGGIYAELTLRVMKTLTWILAAAVCSLVAICLWFTWAQAPLRHLMIAPRLSALTEITYIRTHFPWRLASIPSNEGSGSVFTRWALSESDRRTYALIILWFCGVLAFSCASLQRSR